jgi:diguanylate cyclase (GGDEF)-like protein
MIDQGPWTSATAAEVAQAAGAVDMFVFRRVSEGRYVHLGGAGRGTGWAGIVELGEADEPFVQSVIPGDSVLRRTEDGPWQVFGPYYGHAVAAVRVSTDVLVIFGAPSDTFAAISDSELLELAQLAGESVAEVAPAKRLADELEVLHAVQDLVHTHAETFPDGLERLVDQATMALSCDLGLAYLSESKRAWLCDRRGGSPLDPFAVQDALATIGERATFPSCIQKAGDAELPAPFGVADGVVAYYLLELKRPLPGFLLVLHTRASAARGFTLLCQSLGHRLVDAAEPLLAAALLRDSMRDELERAGAEARRDSLTGLSNRLGWTEALASISPGEGSPVSIVKLDCRGLKKINDTYGHHAGDRVLCRIAGALTACIREDDLAARAGGDEFSILLCGADEELAVEVIGRIERTVAGENGFADIPIELSIGTITARDDDLEWAERCADERMVAAKRRARGDSSSP